MDKLTPEDELLILQQGLQSPFWALISTKWDYFRTVAMKSLLSPDYDKRDFLAGKVAGMDALLGYPEKHIATLESKILQNKK